MKQIPLAISLEPSPTFDNFVPGMNEPVLDHMRRLRASAPPVYLWGQPGSGKSHLLSALAHQHQQAGAAVGWFAPAEPLPWTLHASWSLLVLDDVHQLDAQEQAAAFVLFNEATAGGVLLAAAGAAPPVDLPLRDDLRTRLGWGHVFEVKCLSEDESRAALRRHADQRGLMLSDEVMGYLLSRYSRDLKSLVVLLAELDQFALATSRAVTVPLLKQLLAEREATA